MWWGKRVWVGRMPEVEGSDAGELVRGQVGVSEKKQQGRKVKRSGSG